MTFKAWIFSDYTNNPSVNGAWGAEHITVLVFCILLCIELAFLRKATPKIKRGVSITLASLILIFELSRRIINLIKMQNMDFDSGAALWDHLVYIMIPRPWCAISCWLTMASVVVNKKSLYNVASMCSLLCAIIFFAYPEAGFTNEIYLFENVYSISTHALLLVSSVTAITLGFCDFRYYRGSLRKSALPELISILAIFLYALLEIALGIESDPLYFMPGSGVAKVLGMEYGLFLPVYIIFIIVYFNLFYLFTIPKARKMKQIITK